MIYNVSGDKIALTSPFKGKTFNILGDSITAGANISVRYWEWLQNLLGCTCNNYGISGTSIAQNSNKPSQAFYIRYADMANGADVVIVMGGTNDKWHGSTLGTMGDTTGATFYGAMDVLCQGLRSKYPTATIVFVTPAEMTGFSFLATASVEDFANAMKEMCSKYAINVFDHRIISGIYPYVEANKNLYTIDGVHLNNYSHELLGKRLANYLLNIAAYPTFNDIKIN